MAAGRITKVSLETPEAVGSARITKVSLVTPQASTAAARITKVSLETPVAVADFPGLMQLIAGVWTQVEIVQVTGP